MHLCLSNDIEADGEDETSQMKCVMEKEEEETKMDENEMDETS